MQIIVGIDIGGTKSAISFAEYDGEDIRFHDKVMYKTKTEDYHEAFAEYIEIIHGKLTEHKEWQLCAIGISCGGPLDAEKGLILSPPNLPKWDKADIFTPLKEAFDVPVMLQNDADACALAEWSMGAGKGTRNMIFLTFGTGMGAGLILNGQLYRGTNSMAGEVGHIRLEKDGPLGYGKHGSFEGFCSGGGIANLGRIEAEKAILSGIIPAFCKSQKELPFITCKKIADALEDGDRTAKRIFDVVASHLGMGIAVLIDILNPEMVVIGSIFTRQHPVLETGMKDAIEKEALAESAKACRIVPAKLGELIGDYAAVSVGILAYQGTA